MIDDGSDDYTEELMEFYCSRDRRIHFHYRPKNRLRGGNAARNYGFELSKGEFIQWFDSDNVMLPNKLKFKVETLQSDNSHFVVCENAEIVQRFSSIVKKKWPIKKEGDVLFNHLAEHIAFDTSGPMFRSGFLKGKTLFAESMLIGQDWQFFSRLLINRPKISYIPQVLYHLRTLDGGIRLSKTKEKIRSKIEGELELFRLIKKSQYFNDTEYRLAYNKIVFYRMLSRYQFICSNYSTAAGIKYLVFALPTIDRFFFINGIKKSLIKRGNFLNLFKIITK